VPPGRAGQAGRAPPIVGLRREREVLAVALAAGRHVVIEGPPGTGKSTLLRDIARQAGQAVVFAEGNAELTPARLIGQYDPAQVLNEGYVPASFTDGPLLRAMRSGALLYLEGRKSPSGEERRYPWGNDVTQPVPGNFDFGRWDPVGIGAHVEGASAFGVHDLVGNGWEWTTTTFGPFEGFSPLPSYPEYSAEFFDEEHFVMKGASPVTATALTRRGFRNWFRPRYPYVYATFRLAKDLR